MAKTNVGKSYQEYCYDMPPNRMAALVCVYQGRPLASTLFSTSMFAEECTNAGMCADCCYRTGNLKYDVHAYYTDGKLFLMAEASTYSAVFMVF